MANSLTRTHAGSAAPAPIVRTHLDELTGPLGIYQHANGSRPNLAEGYCTDDVARAAIVDILHGRVLGPRMVAESLSRSLQFLGQAVEPASGRFRNSRTANGDWPERVGSADSHARAVQALGVVVGDAGDDPMRPTARRLFDATLPVTLALEGLRPWAHVALGCVAATSADHPPSAAWAVLEQMARRLLLAFESTDAAWPWPEPVVTYENAILAHALIEAGRTLADPRSLERGLTTLEWLLRAQVTPDGDMDLVGNQGWWRRGESPAHFDQQPIDAAALVEACAAAWRATRDPAWLAEMRRAYGWFLGGNPVGVALADPARGSCCDGLGPLGVNANQGAELTLAWLTATEVVRDPLAGRQDGGARWREGSKQSPRS